MKVYSIKAGQPQSGKSREFAHLNCNQRVYRLLSPQVRKGRPIQGWKNVEMYIDNPTSPRPDFFWSSLDIICNQKARDIVGCLLERSGELLPMTIKGEPGVYYFFNPTPALDAMNPKHSIWEYSKEHEISMIEAPAFQPDRLSKVAIFKEQKRLGSLYCVEKTGDFQDGEFKALVEKYGLSGLSFDLMWSEAEGPTLPIRIWGPNDPYEFRRFDGSPWFVQKENAPKATPASEITKTRRPSSDKQKRRPK